jgi:hypothetical protein
MIAGGSYEFRYRANEDSSFYHSTNVNLQAPGYYPYPYSALVVYGSELEINILMDPILTGVQPIRPLPTTLYQNYPNPFNPTTTIPYDVEADGEVSLKVHDTTGAVVRTLVNGFRTAGHYNENWSGENDRGHVVSSGVYFYRLETNGLTSTLKMTLLK